MNTAQLSSPFPAAAIKYPLPRKVSDVKTPRVGDFVELLGADCGKTGFIISIIRGQLLGALDKFHIQTNAGCIVCRSSGFKLSTKRETIATA